MEDREAVRLDVQAALVENDGADVNGVAAAFVALGAVRRDGYGLEAILGQRRDGRGGEGREQRNEPGRDAPRASRSVARGACSRVAVCRGPVHHCSGR